MFGDDGIYELLRVSFEDRIEEIFDLETDYIYTITLRTGDIDEEDDFIDSKEESRHGF